MSVESILKFLKMAEEYRKSYPGLTVAYAVGLTVFGVGSDAPGVVERCAASLGSRDMSEGYPGGEISQKEYESMCGRFEQMQGNLFSTRGLRLDPGDPETLMKMIKRLSPS